MEYKAYMDPHEIPALSRTRIQTPRLSLVLEGLILPEVRTEASTVRGAPDPMT